MLGRYVYTYFKSKNFDVVGLSRKNIDISDIYCEDDLNSILHYEGVEENDVIINCAGIIKSVIDNNNIQEIIKVNSLFPHYLNTVSKKEGYKLIHVTTDCFLSQTKVLTKNGYVNIEDININDKVYTHSGEIKNVYKTLSKYVNESVYSIKTMGNDTIRCTKNHPWFVIKRDYKEFVDFNKLEWIKTEDLSEGDVIVIPKLSISEQTIKSIDLLDYSFTYRNQIEEYDYFLNNIKNKKINIKYHCKSHGLNYRKISQWLYNENQQPKVYKLQKSLEINEDVLWFLGLFLAEGWVDNSKNRKVITISLGNESELINKTISIIKKYFHINPLVRHMKKQKGSQITFTHQLLSEMLKKDFYFSEKAYSHTKKIPYWINNIGKENLISFIRGYFDGDGCFFEDNKKSCFVSMSSTSEILIDDMKILFMKLGILPNKSSIINNRSSEICGRSVNIKNKYILQISGAQIGKFLNIFKINSEYFSTINRYNRFFENDKYWGIPITEISEELYHGVVYNLEVEDDHSYLVNGGLSAHNCVFSGKDGLYLEHSPHDCIDVYGKTKSLGEPNDCTVIRTSIIGEEVNQSKSLLEWIKSMKDKTVYGYTNHIWNGLTCLQLAKIFEDIIINEKYWRGVRHIFSPHPISKHHLIKLISNIYDLNITINPLTLPVKCDRSLATSYPDASFTIPDINDQIKEQLDFINILSSEI